MDSFGPVLVLFWSFLERGSSLRPAGVQASTWQSRVMDSRARGPADAVIYGNAYELFWGKTEHARLENEAEMVEGQCRIYIYGKELSTAHEALLHGFTICDDAIKTAAVESLKRGTSRLMGIDGMWILVGGEKPPRVDGICECKTGKTPSVFGTFKQSAELCKKGIKAKIIFVSPSSVKICVADMDRMREHGHEVINVHFDPSTTDMQEAMRRFSPQQMSTRAPLSGETCDRRGWQREESEAFRLAIGKGARRYRARVTWGGGKGIAVAYNAHKADPLFRFRVVSCPSIRGLEQMKEAFGRVGRGECFVECDYKTSGPNSSTQEAPDEEERKRQIRHTALTHANGGLLDANAGRPPTLLCLTESLGTVYDAFSSVLGRNELLVMIDEAHKLTDASHIERLLGNPRVTVGQYSATFCDSDAKTPPAWRFAPQYTYSYGQSVRDGVNVPIDVHLLDEAAEDEDRVAARIGVSVRIVTLFPYDTMITLSTIEEARQHRRGLMESHLGEHFEVVCVHSRMAREEDGHARCEDAMRAIRGATQGVIAIFVQMANSNLDLPQMHNLIDHRLTMGSVDDAAQKLSRICRCSPDKQRGNFFKESSAAEAIYMVKERYDDEGNISVRRLSGGTLAEMGWSAVTERPRAKLEPNSEIGKRLQEYRYRQAFPDLARKAVGMVKNKKQRAACRSNGTSVDVPYLNDTVERSLSGVLDDVCRVYQKKVSFLELAEDFPYPSYVKEPRETADCAEKVLLGDIHLTEEEKARLHSQHGDRQLRNEELEFIKKSVGKRNRGYVKLVALWNAGEFRRKDGRLVSFPWLKNFGVSVDVGRVCNELNELQNKGLKVDDGTLKWTFQRVKLVQMGLIGHQKYAKMYRLEEARVEKGVEKESQRTLKRKRSSPWSPVERSG